MSLCLLVFYVMMEPDIENMTFNKYLMYKGRNRDLTRNCTSRNRGACFKVAPVRSRILVYPNSNKEEEEYYRLSPLLTCFKTPQPCTKFNSIPHNDMDIDSMTLDENTNHEDGDQEDGELLDFHTFSITNVFASGCEQVDVNVNINIAKEKEEVIIEDVERLRQTLTPLDDAYEHLLLTQFWMSFWKKSEMFS
ncbi:hypothetical protein Tco_0291147 [Tanacetum coccineum]